jgi:hypothetical protein
VPNLEELNNGGFFLFCFFLYKENYIKTKVLLHHGYVPVSDIGYDE